MPGPVRTHRDGTFGLAVALTYQIKHQERHHERTEPIDERAAEENPRCSRQGAEVFAQCGQSEEAYSNSKRTRRRMCPRIAPRSVPPALEMTSLMSATRE